MKLHQHTAISAVISGILYIIFKSWSLSLASFIWGIFIDLDHIIDYLREQGWPFRIKNFFQICHKCQFDRLMLLWHGWEWLALCIASAWLTDWNPWITGTLIGLSHHMVLDMYYYKQNFRSYSLLYRWKNDFHFDTVFHSLKSKKYEYREYSPDTSGS